MGFRAPAAPIRHARVTFTRLGPRLLDADNLAGAFKPILDILRPVSVSNPNGLGLILDDDAAHLDVTYQQAVAGKGRSMTRIVIEPATRGKVPEITHAEAA